MVSMPAEPLRVSLPSPPERLLLAELPVRRLASELPVALMEPVPVRMRFSTLAMDSREKEMELSTRSVPAATASVMVSVTESTV